MSNKPMTILRATDDDGSQITIYECTLPTWGWQYTNSKRHEFDYGWALSKEEAILKSQRFLKPSPDGSYPSFQVMEVK